MMILHLHRNPILPLSIWSFPQLFTIYAMQIFLQLGQKYLLSSSDKKVMENSINWELSTLSF